MPPAFEYPVFKIGLTFISSTFYGCFLVLFAISLFVLHQQHKKNARVLKKNAYLVFSYLMLVVLTTVWILSAIMCFDNKLTEIKGISDYSSLMLAQHVIGYLASLIGDAVMVYRLYVISDRKRVILCITVLLVFCGLGLVLAVIFTYALHHDLAPVPPAILVALSICVNVTATTLIAGKVWKRQAIGGGKTIFRLLAIFIESSALYTLWMIIFFITHFADNPLSQVFLYGSPHIAGIASMLINVRVGLGWAVGEEGRSTRSLSDSAFIDSRLNYDF